MGRGNVLVLIGSQKLISANIASTSDLNKDQQMYQEFLDFIKSKKGENDISSYLSALTNDNNNNIKLYEPNEIDEVILILDQNDLK